jgi:hypothetical protein
MPQGCAAARRRARDLRYDGVFRRNTLPRPTNQITQLAVLGAQVRLKELREEQHAIEEFLAKFPNRKSNVRIPTDEEYAKAGTHDTHRIWVKAEVE